MWWAFGGFAVLMVVSGIGTTFEAATSHEVDAGSARFSGAYLAEDCGDRYEGCADTVPTVGVTDREGAESEVEDDGLYARVRERGPFTAPVRWNDSSHEIAQVRVDGEWVVIAHTRAAGGFEGVALLIGGSLLLVAAVHRLRRRDRGPDGHPAADAPAAE
jgi:hypothetical protein